MRADKTDDSSRADRAEWTISSARHTALIEERERFEARRWATRLSREISLRIVELDCEAAGDIEAWLLFRGEDDILMDLRYADVRAMSGPILIHDGELYAAIETILRVVMREGSGRDPDVDEAEMSAAKRRG